MVLKVSNSNGLPPSVSNEEIDLSEKAEQISKKKRKLSLRKKKKSESVKMVSLEEQNRTILTTKALCLRPVRAGIIEA